MSVTQILHRRNKPSKAQVSSVRAELERTSARIAALSRPAMTEFLPILRQAEREVTRDLARWISEHRGERYTVANYRNTLLHLRQSMQTIRGLEPALFGTMSRMQEDLAQMASDVLTRELALLSKVFDGVQRSIQVNLSAVTASGNHSMIPRFRSSAARYSRNVRDDIKRELAVGIVRGESVVQMTGRLSRIGGVREAVPANAARGLFGRFEYWAERIVRTETVAAYSAMSDASFLQARQLFPDLTRRWDASMDARTCKVCYDLNGETAGYGMLFPGEIDAPPAHPHCRCRLGVWRKDWNDILREADS